MTSLFTFLVHFGYPVKRCI